MYKRNETRPVYVGNVQIGGQTDVVIQSMTSTDTRNIEATVRQIEALKMAGCQIVRLAVIDIEAAEAIKEIKKRTTLPLVADIHFDYKLAITALENGIDKIRINPGNIGSIDKVRKVVEACNDRKVAIRIGINSGSIEKEILHKYGHPTAEGMVESAMKHIEMLEDLDFEDIVISLKSSNVLMMIQAYYLMAEKRNYPLHVGVTEAGTIFSGSIKSAIGIGSILSGGIGDTIRVSLTADPVEEIKVAKEILKDLDIRNTDPQIISCPTCGRTQINLEKLANKVEKALFLIDKPLKIAVMGCAVNGPGEAKEADVGVAGGNGEGLIFRNGEIVRKVKEENLFEELMKEIEDIIGKPILNKLL
ncbi:MAG: flavodoxin-dependent (E)-4-hydroxy-3-methylbut-2-enyl-diphosphate synthase [Vulcanibacillus sp.]